MNKLFILVGFTLSFSLLFAQECNKNVYSDDEAVKLSNYGKNLEKSILEKNPSDTALIAKLQGDYSTDLCGYNDDAVIKISNYLKELEKLDSINKIIPIVEEKPVVVEEQKVDTTLKVTNLNGSKENITILFSPNSSKINSKELTKMLSVIKSNKNSKIIIDGYSDSIDTDEYNISLSRKRANAVKTYLVSKGVKASRITVNAYGETNPVADNETPEGRAKNRRVVISIK